MKTDAPVPGGVGVRLLAFGCAICPLCICARRWPESRFAKTMLRIERLCPMCRAYRALHGREEESRAT